MENSVVVTTDIEIKETSKGTKYNHIINVDGVVFTRKSTKQFKFCLLVKTEKGWMVDSYASKIEGLSSKISYYKKVLTPTPGVTKSFETMVVEIKQPTEHINSPDKVIFTNDLNEQVYVSEEDFREEAIHAVQVALIENQYSIDELSYEYLQEELTGVIASFCPHDHNLSENGKKIIKSVLDGYSDLIQITRAVNGVTINGQEVLLNDYSYPMLFGSEKEAKKYLLANGENDFDGYNFAKA